MYHSITIGDKNTWDDWHLIPTTRPFVALPTVNEKTVEVPGRNGSIDLTTFLTGSPTYGNRKGSWEFYISNEYFIYSDPRFVSGVTNWSSWSAALRTIANYCHGKIRTVVLEDDPNYSYEGRLKVSSFTPQKEYSTIVIEYNLDPYKTNIETGATSLY